MQIMLASTQFGDKWPKSRYNVTCPTNNSYRTKDDVWFMICYGSYDIFYDHVMRSIGLDDLIGDERYNRSSVINDGRGINTEVVKILEDQFATQDWEYWERIFKENDFPYQRLYQAQDILNDEEAYANDILRSVHYDALGEKVLPTSPIRFESMGDPVLRKSRPIGYDTARPHGGLWLHARRDRKDGWHLGALLWRRRDARIGVRPQLRAAFEEGLRKHSALNHSENTGGRIDGNGRRECDHARRAKRGQRCKKEQDILCRVSSSVVRSVTRIRRNGGCVGALAKGS